MHGLLPLVIAALLAGPSAAAVADAQSPDAASIWQALPCDRTAEFYKDGQLRECTLTSSFRVGEHEIPAGSHVSRGRGSHLVGVRLSRETPIFGQPLPANTRLIFFADGQLRSFWLDADTTIQGHPLAAQHDGIGNTLYPTGQLRAAGLARDDEIGGVPCTSSRNLFTLGVSAFVNGDNARVLFHPNGRVRQCRLARTVTLDGRRFARGEVIRLRPDGTVDSTAEPER